jgi:phosphatidylserine synthase
VASLIWLYLVLRHPGDLEVQEGTPTPFSHVLELLAGLPWTPLLSRVPLALVFWTPILGLLMVSRVRYLHGTRFLTRARSNFFTLVWLVFAVFLFFLAPVPILFLVFNGFALLGVVGPHLFRGRKLPAPA